MNYKIGILVPTTSNKRDYIYLKQSDFYDKFLKSFLTTYNQEHIYTIYLGIDDDDIFFMDNEIQSELFNFIKIMKNVSLKIYTFEKCFKGNVCHIWNELFKFSYNDGNEYFHQTGDDIIYLDKDWINTYISVLRDNLDFGVAGHSDKGRKLYNPNDTLITQSFVSRIHMRIFGFYFAPELLNWGIDNWLGDIYEPHKMKYIISQEIINTGGAPRYNIDDNYNEKLMFCLRKYKNNISDYLK